MKDRGEVDGSPLWLGLDISTQSLTLVLLPDTPGAPHIYLDAIVYARDLPQYQTEHGMHISDGDDGEKVRCVVQIHHERENMSFTGVTLFRK